MSARKCMDPKIGRLSGAYAFGVLPTAERERFELHLTQCSYCFDELYAEHEIIAALKTQAPRWRAMLEEMPQHESKRSLVERFFALLSLKQWALATFSVVGISAVGIYVIERSKPAEFGSGRETTTERALEAYQPKGDVDEIPREFHWQKVKNAAYYEVEIYDSEGKTLWRAKTDVEQHQ